MKGVCESLIGALLILGCALSQVVHAQGAVGAGVNIENIRIFDGTSAELSAPSNVLVVDNVIRAISTAPIPAPAGVTVTKVAGGRTLMPGLIDNHVHVTFMAGTSPQAEMLAPKTRAPMSLAGPGRRRRPSGCSCAASRPCATRC